MWTPGMKEPVEVPLEFEMTGKDVDEFITFWSKFKEDTEEEK